MARMFVEGWAPEYGAPFDPDEQMAPAEGTIDPTVELTDWEPLEGVDDGIDQIGFVDGVAQTYAGSKTSPQGATSPIGVSVVTASDGRTTTAVVLIVWGLPRF